MAKATDGFSGADITEICQRAAKNAIRESVAAGVERSRAIAAGEATAEDEYDDPVPFIRRDHFEEAMSRARRSVSDKDIRQYEQFMAQMKSDAQAAGAGGFSFDAPDGATGGDGIVADEKDLYE